MKRMLKVLLFLVLALACAIGALAAVKWAGLWPAPNNSPSLHAGPTIEQLQMLSELVVTRVEVSDVQETTVRGYVGGRKVVLAVKGDALIGVDLSVAKLLSKDETTRTVVLSLPQPRVFSVRVDHDRTRIAVDESEGLWVIVPGDAGRSATVNKAYGEAQRWLAGAATGADLIDRSRRHAEQVIGSFFGATGWTVTIRWQQ